VGSSPSSGLEVVDLAVICLPGDAPVAKAEIRRLRLEEAPEGGGMVYVEREGLDDAELRGWAEQAAAGARSLPPKAKT
jgi:hypothetical protein